MTKENYFLPALTNLESNIPKGFPFFANHSAGLPLFVRRFTFEWNELVTTFVNWLDTSYSRDRKIPWARATPSLLKACNQKN